MGALRRLMGLETRASAPYPTSQPAPGVKASDPYLATVFGWRSGHASPDMAVSSLAVASRCVGLISEALASVPLRVMRLREDGTKEPAPDHYLDRLLNGAPNDLDTAFRVRAGLVRDVLTVGNGYWRMEIDGRGRVAALHYLPRLSVGVERLPSGRLRYRVSEAGRGSYILTQDEIVHARYDTRDGVMGIGPLEWAAGAVGLAVAQADLAQTQVDRGFTPDLSFETDAAFYSSSGWSPNDASGQSESAFKRLKAQLTERVKKMGREPSPLLLEGGLTAKQLSTSGREAQFHESRITGLEDIARIFGVPLSVVGLGRNASYGSLTEESRALVRDCYQPWARRIEEEIERCTLTTEGRRQYVIRHDLSGLLRGDPSTQIATYAQAVTATLMTINEARRELGLPPVPGGDLRANPNTTSHSSPASQEPAAAAA